MGYISIFNLSNHSYEFAVEKSDIVPFRDSKGPMFCIEMNDGLEETWLAYKSFLDAHHEFRTEDGTYCSNPDNEPSTLRSILLNLGYKARIITGFDTLPQEPWLSGIHQSTT